MGAGHREGVNMSEFARNDIVRHMVTRGEYRIVCPADNCRLEATNQPAYAYQGVNKEDAIVWVREQKEMEERFVFVSHEEPKRE